MDLAGRILQVRMMEDKIETMEKEFKEKIKPLQTWAEKARAEIMQHLNDTNQKLANTINGSADWRPRITYRVEDKDEFRRHVIGTESWELLTWAAANVACEEFTQASNVPPPGLARNEVRILYINPPPKSRQRKTSGNGAEAPKQEDTL